jgi:hypothetical protein
MVSFIIVAASQGAAAPSHTVTLPSLPSDGVFVQESVLADRDFPLLSELLNSHSAHQVLASDSELRRITQERWSVISAANRDCGDNLTCKAQAAQFTPLQIDEISASLHRIYTSEPVFEEFVRERLTPASMYSLDGSRSGVELLLDNWRLSAAALNQIIATYCEGIPPRYKEIDAMTYAPDSHTYAALVRIILDGLSIQESSHTGASDSANSLFFEPSLRFALRLLQSNSRDEAGRFWPLKSGENAAAVARAHSLAWAKYRYTAIVIPGAGSEVAGVQLSPWGKERLRLGVAAYRSGLAPFVLVSGGFVHPSQTPYCEAVEMKKYLMEIYKISASAILIEPYARHTTTNLRNAAREILNYGFPSAHPMLIVSDAAQLAYIEGPEFRQRAMKELGYLPVTLGKRLSPTQLDALPSSQSMFRDPTDPLDP